MYHTISVYCTQLQMQWCRMSAQRKDTVSVTICANSLTNIFTQQSLSSTYINGLPAIQLFIVYMYLNYKSRTMVCEQIYHAAGLYTQWCRSRAWSQYRDRSRDQFFEVAAVWGCRLLKLGLGLGLGLGTKVSGFLVETLRDLECIIGQKWRVKDKSIVK